MVNKYSGIWIPDKVWEFNDLTVMEKLFLVKITGLDGEKGCYASNKYFSEFFKLSRSRCSVIISSLKLKGYIAISYAYEGLTKEIERRIIKVKKIVVKAVKKTNRYIKRVGATKAYINYINKVRSNSNETIDSQNTMKSSLEKSILDINEKRNENEIEIECLELSGTSGRRRGYKVNNKESIQLGIFEDEIITEHNKVVNRNENKTSNNKNLKNNEKQDKKAARDRKIDNNIVKTKDLNKVIGVEKFPNRVSPESLDNWKAIEIDNNIKESEGDNNTKEYEDKNLIYKENEEYKKIIYEDIINYLNLKSTKCFKSTTVKTLKHINARLREGNTVNDFKKVINKKCDEWLNTSMEEYLRPETLFGTKFEIYLNENSSKKNNNFKNLNYKGGEGIGKGFKNARNNRENKGSKENTRYGIATPLTREELERAKREIF